MVRWAFLGTTRSRLWVGTDPGLGKTVALRALPSVSGSRPTQLAGRRRGCHLDARAAPPPASNGCRAPTWLALPTTSSGRRRGLSQTSSISGSTVLRSSRRPSRGQRCSRLCTGGGLRVQGAACRKGAGAVFRRFEFDPSAGRRTGDDVTSRPQGASPPSRVRVAPSHSGTKRPAQVAGSPAARRPSAKWTRSPSRCNAVVARKRATEKPGSRPSRCARTRAASAVSPRCPSAAR